MQLYNKKEAEKIIGSRLCEFDVSNDGIRPKLVSVENAEFDQLNNWSPLCELDGDDGLDPEIAPALPFPFAANHLAAWMVHGGGYFVREQYGDWSDGPDPQAISKLGMQATKAKQALKRAFHAYRAAERVVGPYDPTYSEKIQETEKQYGSWPDAQEARERIKQAHCDADAYDAAWRNKMVNQLLVPTNGNQQVEEFPLAQKQENGTPAPVVADNAGPLPLTTNEIANCFAGLRDWDVKRWKSELGSPDVWLKACQHRKGTRGRGGYESTWLPVQIAVALVKQDKKSARALRARFKKQKRLQPWFDLFEINIPDDADIR